jgi:ATP-binding cassette subfamily B protein
MTDTYSKALVGHDRIKEILAIDLQVRDLPDASRAPQFTGAVEFEHVNFGYVPDRPVLNDVSLEIKPGQVAALVGPTGSGKTTLISLIPRFYDPQSGTIRIDGVDVRKYQRKTVREQISFVLQDTLLFRAPIWQNIAYGKPEASHAEILRAARLANGDEFIERLPQGYETMVGERGVTLSGGQRQRIAIARAIIRNTSLLILDEPTTGLDAASEKLVLEALGRLMVNKTTIMVAHRLATIQSADVVFVLNGGVICQRGTHKELLAAKGLYAEFYEMQSRKETEDEQAGENPLLAGVAVKREVATITKGWRIL